MDAPAGLALGRLGVHIAMTSGYETILNTIAGLVMVHAMANE
jgi:hypothetical protein